MFRVTVLCTSCLLFCAQPATADDVQWRVVLSSGDPGISQPQLPAAHYFVGVGLADGGAGLLGFQLRPSGTSTPDGNWFERGTGFAPYAQIGASGALGPGRAGAESTHVFRRLYYGDSIGEGARAFGATANDPGDPAGNAAQGLWLFDGSRNVEIARLGNDGILGPGLGSGAVYKSFHNVDSLTDEMDVRALPNRRVLFAGRISTDGSLGDDGLSQYVPGQGNRPCLLQRSTDPDLGPGIAAAVFSRIDAGVSVSPRGEVYDYASVTPVSGSPPGWYGAQGIWQFCDGAPRMAVLTGETNQYGPGLPDGSAYFGGDNNGLKGYLAPSTPGSFYFTSGGRTSSVPGAATFLGLFHHDAAAGHNVPILLDRAEGTYGPQIVGYVFNTATVPFKVKAGGRYAVLQTSISPANALSSSYPGLWRLSTDGTVEPLALAGDTGAYAPAAGRIWNGTFYKYAAFDNGDIVTLADTRDLSTSRTAVSWWRLRRGSAPVEILKVGDLVQVATPGGTVSKPVSAIDPYYAIGLPPTSGRDTWFSANGTIATSDIVIQGFESATVLVRGLAARPDHVFSAGFD